MISKIVTLTLINHCNHKTPYPCRNKTNGTFTFIQRQFLTENSHHPLIIMDIISFIQAC